MTIPYASLCTECEHYASQHLWDHHAGGMLVDGPYVCSECGCSQPQDGPFVGLTKRQYEDREAART